MTPIPQDIYTVSRLNREAKLLLEASFPMIWVDGELSNLARPASGHLYFSLKDAQAQIRCALFRSQLRHIRCQPRDGLQVLIKGRVSLYEGRGDFQLIVESMEEAGEGALQRAFDALKRKLSEEGLFDPTQKRSLPRLPKRIGIITSPAGAVLHDILTTLKRRFPAIPVLVYPVPVQGKEAVDDIVATLKLASARQDCDALILARGGGSLEDLWSFNDERVARAIHACKIPIVCGVGHETDFTIADLVADVRAPTPTAAAEILSPEQTEWLMAFHNQEKHLGKLIQDTLRGLQQRLDWLSARVVHPSERIQRNKQRWQELSKRLRLTALTNVQTIRVQYTHTLSRLHQQSPQPRIREQLIVCRHLDETLIKSTHHYLTNLNQRFKRLGQELHTLSPLATLDRGYAIVRHEQTGKIIRQATSVDIGDSVEARLAQGRLYCLVTKRKANGA